MISPYFHEVTKSSDNFPNASDQGLLVLGSDGKPTNKAYSNGYVYDLFQPEARKYAFDAVTRGYITPYGLHHWWLDCDEPCDSGELSDVLYNKGQWPAQFVGSAFPHMVDMMVFEHMPAEYAQVGEYVAVTRTCSSRRRSCQLDLIVACTLFSEGQCYAWSICMGWLSAIRWGSLVGGYFK